MKKIVKGNDFTLRIPVMKMVEGQAKAFPLPACTDVVVQVCNQFKRIPLAFEIDVKEDNVLLARIEGDKMSLGTYAIEVKGKIFGNDWRSNEYPQFSIVSNNADAYPIHKGGALIAATGCVGWCMSVCWVPTAVIALIYLLLVSCSDDDEGYKPVWYMAEVAGFLDVFVTYWITN